MEQEKYLAVRDGIKRELLSDMDFTREMSDEEIQDAIADRLRAREFAGRLNVYERARMGKELFFTIPSYWKIVSRHTARLLLSLSA